MNRNILTIMKNKYDLLFNATEAYSKNTTRNG